MELGNKIYELRKDYKLSQEQLAEKLKVTRQTISNWELGQTTPDIFQAKQLSKIFKVSLDELVNNDMKDILVEKINHTEKMANTTINMLKFICGIIIFFLIIIIVSGITLIIKQRKENIEIQSQMQSQEQEYREYIKNSQFKRLHFTINDAKYDYVIQYGKDYKPIGEMISQMSVSTTESYKSYNTHLKYIRNSFNNYTDVNERIKDLKQYFEQNGGTWEEVEY